MQLLYFDLPELYSKTDEGMDFIFALEENDDLELFALKSVQILIDVQHDYWSVINYTFFGLPLLL